MVRHLACHCLGVSLVAAGIALGMQCSAWSQEPAKVPRESAPPAAVSGHVRAEPDNWEGQFVISRPGVVLKAAGTSTPISGRDQPKLPWKVTKVNGDWLWMGKTWIKKQDVLPVGDSEEDKKLVAHSEAIRLNPRSADDYMMRGFAYQRLGMSTEALADFDVGVNLNPENCSCRTPYLLELGMWKPALADYDSMIKRHPQQDIMFAFRALLLASCPDDKVRNGARALADAKHVFAVRKDVHSYRALAAAYAEIGDFDRAVRVPEECLKMLEKSVRFIEPELGQQLELYRAKKPYRMTKR